MHDVLRPNRRPSRLSTAPSALLFPINFLHQLSHQPCTLKNSISRATIGAPSPPKILAMARHVHKYSGNLFSLRRTLTHSNKTVFGAVPGHVSSAGAGLRGPIHSTCSRYLWKVNAEAARFLRSNSKEE
jgi:hypothetical protein